ncbi:uncharacterized protein LOC111701311 isoform X2 [Eurytemora carolleeae]|uniref:uncharacterized protein LOC111701311 isoform X2 n=1 Tax=Eurytemora carolleeae TaxID=1294199 RepID=UPI000C792BA1|nr:uncharacterized protein LOC111701311 isoform X2 [Eurytemora carolleeae]|eukprot:XP_023328307.1 uncharacterized protein LOC111701311 isoform X2 [Eurytemora affinis]
MIKCLVQSRFTRCLSWTGVRRQSMFKSGFEHLQHIKKDDSKTHILYLNAAHSPTSLVSHGARILLENLQREKAVEEVKLWTEQLVPYKIDHALSKLKLLRGEGTDEDKDRFAPVLTAAEIINSMDVVVVATPMWNYTIPYVLKQYIDSSLTKNSGRILVVISSAGAEYGPGEEIQDFLNPYLKQVFALMGFTRFFPIFIQGTASRSKTDCLEWTEKEAKKCATELNKILEATSL